MQVVSEALGPSDTARFFERHSGTFREARLEVRRRFGIIRDPVLLFFGLDLVGVFERLFEYVCKPLKIP